MADPKPQSKAVYRAKRVLKDIALDALFPYLYKQACKKCPSPDKVIFLETKESVMPLAMRHVWERLLAETNYQAEFITLRQNNSRIPRYYVNCRDAVSKLAQASHIFLCDASDLVSGLPIRSETKVIQLWHGAGAFKKWGLSTADLKFGESRQDQLRHPFYGNLDLVCVSSPEVVWAYEEAMGLGAPNNVPGVVQPIGVAGTDVYFDQHFVTRAYKKVVGRLPDIAGRKIILYAPTFRGRVRYAQGPDDLDIPAMRAALGSDYVLVVKHHPYVKEPPAIPDECKDFAFDVSKMDALPIEVLLCAADVCITDYSSLVFDYSLLGRPMAFFAPDRASYDEWRGFYYDYDELTPGPVFSQTADLVDYLVHVQDSFDEARMQTFRNKFMSACDGHACDRIFEFAFGSQMAAHPRISAHTVLRDVDPDGVDISIVIPAHNAQDSIERALEHLQRQTYPSSRMEVLVVDDGSTDATAQRVEQFVAQDPALFHLTRLPSCSGTPAAPRNTGLMAARGTYVFFHDADDWLEDDAVERMLDAAVAWGSDVLLVKLYDENGRGLPQSMFQYSEPDVDIYTAKVMWSFAPIKLFRRSLVADMRFPNCMPEDISFVLRAYVQAQHVSVAADGDYYHATLGAHEHQASQTTWDNAETNLEAYRDIFAYIAENVSDAKRDAVLMRRLFWRDIYNTFVTIAQEATKDASVAQRHYEELLAIVKPFWREGIYKTAPVEVRAVLHAALEDGLEALRAAVR